jgi:3-methyladenine DNA glycosylase AlkC
MNPSITKIDDVPGLVTRGRANLKAVAKELHGFAASDDWRTREVAATALVEIGKRDPDGVLALAAKWARESDPNVRRAASEGLRGVVKTEPEKVAKILEQLRSDEALYVKKSVANVLRNASRAHPDFVLSLCRRWAATSNPHTRWIVKDGLRKLRSMGSREAEAIVAGLGTA